MKKRHRTRFINTYKWWDYTFLLQAVEDWCNHSSKMHSKHGMSLNSGSKAKVLKTMASLCRRIREDDYKYDGVFVRHQECDIGFIDLDGGYSQVVFTNHTFGEEAYREYVLKRHDYEKSQKQQDLDYLCKLVSKHLFSLWD